MNGYTAEIISNRTGLGLSKLRMIVSRNPVLMSMPYSVKNGRTRVFFDEFVEWLKKYEGITDVESHKSQARDERDSSKKIALPNGRQLAELRMLYPREELAARIDAIMKWAPPLEETAITTPRVQLQIPDRNPERVEKALRPVMNTMTAKERKAAFGAAYGVAKAQEARETQWKQNGKLFDEEAKA